MWGGARKKKKPPLRIGGGSTEESFGSPLSSGHQQKVTLLLQAKDWGKKGGYYWAEKGDTVPLKRGLGGRNGRCPLCRGARRNWNNISCLLSQDSQTTTILEGWGSKRGKKKAK